MHAAVVAVNVVLSHVQLATYMLLPSTISWGRPRGLVGLVGLVGLAGLAGLVKLADRRLTPVSLRAAVGWCR